MALTFNPNNIPNIVVKQGQLYDPYLLPEATGGTDPVVYSLTPALPQGITFDSETRSLLLTPTESKVLTSYTYTALDNAGTTRTLTFDLTVNEDFIQVELDVDRNNALVEEETETRPEYTTIEDETLAGIIYRHYQISNQEILKEVFDANPILSKYPLILPQGVRIILPEINTSDEIEPIALWE